MQVTDTLALKSPDSNPELLPMFLPGRPPLTVISSPLAARSVATSTMISPLLNLPEQPHRAQARTRGDKTGERGATCIVCCCTAFVWLCHGSKAHLITNFVGRARGGGEAKSGNRESSPHEKHMLVCGGANAYHGAQNPRPTDSDWFA